MAALPDAAPQTRAEVRATASLTLATATVAGPALEMPASPTAQVESSWWQRPVEMNPSVALVAAAGLVALGAVLGSALRGQ